MKNQLDEYKIAKLIFLELKGEINEAEKKLLHNWINKSDKNKKLYNKIIDENNIINKVKAYNKINNNDAWEKLAKQLYEKQKIKRISFASLLKYAAIIAIPLLIGGYFLFSNFNQNNNNLIADKQIIIPGTQKAILTTSTNEKIELGKTKRKQIFNFKKATVTDTSETLTYNEKGKETTEIAFNTLETPRGGEYTLVLSDGTKVYLNAETKLVFPETFAGETREVTLDGEAYFEVAKSETNPFIIKTSEYDIKVYGTSFNVSAYATDLINHTTLVEGSIGITLDDNELKLIPGEQANFNKANNKLSKKEVDTYAYTAWKDGKFVFTNESLDNILTRLSRWYNTEVYFENENLKNYHFSGTLNRYDNIGELLDMIALTTNIKFKIENQMILVKEKK